MIALVGVPKEKKGGRGVRSVTGNGARRQPRRSLDPTFWLIVRHQNGQVEVITIDAGGEKALPVFSFEEEAEAFLNLGAPEAYYYWIRETTPGELVSVLYGPCAGVGRVALDPLPEHGGEAIVDLVCLSRERFCKNLVGEHELSARSEPVPDGNVRRPHGGVT
jgi:hypothetical protein